MFDYFWTIVTITGCAVLGYALAQLCFYAGRRTHADLGRGPGANSDGLQQSVIDSISVRKYRKGETEVQETECSVCLGEFEEDESVRVLPNCGHVYHVPCIDTWLRSHNNCPLCRALAHRLM